MRTTPSRFESPIVFVGLVILVVAIGLGLWRWIVIAYPRLDERASFGELFGGINALFAGLAFAALTYTLILQQRSLGIQRTELAKQQRELIAQNDRLETQSFETMLFQLLRFHHDIAKDVRTIAADGRRAIDGREALRQLADELRASVRNVSGRGDSKISIVDAQQGYEEFHRGSRGILDHYFRNLYHIIKFIDSSTVPDKRQYTSLVRAQLSPPELILVFTMGSAPMEKNSSR